MKIPIPAEPDWNCPEGTHRSVLADIRTVSKATKEGQNDSYVRFVFETKGRGKKIYRIGKNYPPNLHKGSPLRQDLETWLGSEVFTLTGSELDLESLRGMEAIITV